TRSPGGARGTPPGGRRPAALPATSESPGGVLPTAGAIHRRGWPHPPELQYHRHENGALVVLVSEPPDDSPRRHPGRRARRVHRGAGHGVVGVRPSVG